MNIRSIPRNIDCAALAAAMLLAASADAYAQPTPGQAGSVAIAKPLPFISPIFGDNMVLQRGKPDTIWSWSEPGDTVRVQIGENTATGTAGTDRRWQVKIQPPAPGGPYTVKITGHQSAELHNVLVGDVRFSEFLPHFLLSIHTGMRMGEQYGLRWSQVDFARRQLLLLRTKNGDPRTIPLNAVALGALQELRGPKDPLGTASAFPSARTGDALQGSRG